MAYTKRIQLTSGALHVESSGSPLGRLVLCVHGLSANCRSFDRYVPVLADAGHHILTMDLRGRGRSDITRHTVNMSNFPPPTSCRCSFRTACQPS